MSHHQKYTPTKSDSSSATQNSEEDDPYLLRIEKTGCFGAHEKLQDCYLNKKDWRECKNEMKSFKECWRQWEERRSVEEKNESQKKS
ncbi:hypothetical protein BKA69DRAFT_700373 [Paraphysoderma sedebokerense]|nr:hypothetical protein BKA69DRAFT_700373 [Paraphysoderma sedebokerense]